MGELENEGDSIERTYSQGSEWTFISNTKANYTIELYGPAALGPGGGLGGLVVATAVLDIGDVVTVKLGPRVPANTGVLDGSNGKDGSGKNEVGVYKSQIYINDVEVIVVGGGGSAGNKGDGDGSHVSSVDRIYSPGNTAGICWCGGSYALDSKGQWRCTRYHHYNNGTGGAGGNGGSGGDPTTTHGEYGQSGSAERSSGVNWYYAGGKGGDGGSGGSSWTAPIVISGQNLYKGGSTGESKVVITLGGELLPPLDSKLIIDIKKEILDAIGQGGSVGGMEDVPIVTVIAGRYFSIDIVGYKDFEDCESGGIQIRSINKEKGILRVEGMLVNVGSSTIELNGETFIFRAIKEPDSANIGEVLN